MKKLVAEPGMSIRLAVVGFGNQNQSDEMTRDLIQISFQNFFKILKYEPESEKLFWIAIHWLPNPVCP